MWSICERKVQEDKAARTSMQVESTKARALWSRGTVLQAARYALALCDQSGSQPNGPLDDYQN